MQSQRIATLTIISLAIAISLQWAISAGPLRNPNEALQDFLAGDAGRAEDMLMDPLILNGQRVVPLVLAEIKNKQMQKRRYAIAFLGNGAYLEALPVLESIVVDRAEIDYFRADALQAIAQISPPHAVELAMQYASDQDLFGKCAQKIAEGKDVFIKRSWLAAFFGTHE
jgi:hypothetical protein